ncbi:capping complex subunit for YIEGIA [Syntrophomonas palmitatica]|uniref:capping complex subunit for YIEGIA n=1 Tax=Syntrophomonas palmitatica TaxID=402877 RepID=UPI000AA97FD2|nr:hypothetical protein [Syntrophomonas palmitatica]
MAGRRLIEIDISIKEYILAIVTLDREKVVSAGCPLIVAADKAEQEKISLYLASILDGVVHDLENGIFFVCKH